MTNEKRAAGNNPRFVYGNQRVTSVSSEFGKTNIMHQVMYSIQITASDKLREIIIKQREKKDPRSEERVKVKASK